MVYFIKSDNLIKIGLTTNIDTRLRSIKSSNPKAELLLTINCDNTENADLEKKLHEQFKLKRISGEWFELSESDIDNICKEYKGLIDIHDNVFNLTKFTSLTYDKYLNHTRTISSHFQSKLIYLKSKTDLDRDSIKFQFGKHKGNTLLNVVKSDPDYIIWLIDNFKLKDKKKYPILFFHIYNMIDSNILFKDKMAEMLK